MKRKPTAAQLDNLKTLTDTELVFVQQCITDKRLRSQVLTLINTGNTGALKAIIQLFRK